MKKKRLIPILLLKNGWLVQSKLLREFKNLGNPITAVKRLSEWGCDELIYLDISRDDQYDLRRDDLNDANRHHIYEILDDVSKTVFMPITVGGKIRSISDIQERLKRGADKVAINTQALLKPEFITQAAKEFGSQCVVVSIDVKLVDGCYMVMLNWGQRPTGYNPVEWAVRCAKLGAGEILLNSIDRDGTKTGFDLELIRQVSEAVSIPVIAAGGAGDWPDFGQVLGQTQADGVAAANIFQHLDQSVYLAKKYLFDHNFNVRPPMLMKLQQKGGV